MIHKIPSHTNLCLCRIVSTYYTGQICTKLTSILSYLTYKNLFHLLRAIACAHANTRATSLMREKIARAISVYGTYCLEHQNEENERKNKNIRFNS